MQPETVDLAAIYNHLTNLELMLWFLVIVLVQIAGGRSIYRTYQKRRPDWIGENGMRRPVK